jgi:hypothetical protein
MCCVGGQRWRLNLHVDGGVEEGGGEELRVALVEDAHGSRVLVRLQLVRRLERDAERRRMSGCTTMLYTCIPHPLLVPSAAEWQWELRGGELACALTTLAWNELAGRAAGQLAWRERAGAGAVCDAGREASESRAREMAYRGGPVLHVHPEVQRRVERPTQHGHIQRHVTTIVEPTHQLHLHHTQAAQRSATRDAAAVRSGWRSKGEGRVGLRVLQRCSYYTRGVR